jgi:hypothetical protein
MADIGTSAQVVDSRPSSFGRGRCDNQVLCHRLWSRPRRPGQDKPGFCATNVIGSTAVVLAFSALDFAIGFVIWWAPEAHTLRPFQALDLIAIGGTLGGIAGVVYGGTHACEGAQ